jgi:hypothetical protein
VEFGVGKQFPGDVCVPVAGEVGERGLGARTQQELHVEAGGGVEVCVRVQHEVLNFDLAKSIDRVGHPPQESRYITLALTGGVGLTEMLHGPRRSLAHQPACRHLHCPHLPHMARQIRHDVADRRLRGKIDKSRPATSSRSLNSALVRSRPPRTTPDQPHHAE